MSRPTFRRAAVAAAAVLLLCTPALAQTPIGRVSAYRAETPHPYPAGQEATRGAWTEEIRSPGATFIKIHFSDFDLARGDELIVTSPDGAERHVYTGRGPKDRGEFWALSIEGDTAIVTLDARRGGGRGYVIDQIGEGLAVPEATPEVVCGTDGRKDVICYGQTVSDALKPVARLLFAYQGGFAACTGWLVRGGNQNTMITNNHCLASQADVDTAEASFNYQHTTCGGSVDAAVTKFFGDTFLKTTAALDYTLFTLAGNPEGLGWGELIPTTLDPTPGSLIAFPQHGGGLEKKIGVFENSNRTSPCDVTAVNQTYTGYAANSQFNYGCDSEGGSSGSPIVSRATQRVVGLHHLGQVTLRPCSNAATHMSRICADAGALLTCASN